MPKQRFCFCTDGEEARQFREFATNTGRTVGSLALIAVRQYLHRYAKEAHVGKRNQATGGAVEEGNVRVPAGSTTVES